MQNLKEEKLVIELVESTQENGLDLPTQYGEIGITAAAAQAKAMVESRYFMALRNPRNWDQVRQDIVRECHRPSFAKNKSSWYIKPIGKGVEGLGIRFVEVALRCMRNVIVETSVVHEDDGKELIRVTVTDLESNLTYPMDIKVTKTVERSRPDSDGSFLSSRKNNRGQEVYTVAATDDDLLNKRMALISKAIRTLGLRIIPGDIQDEAEEIILAVRKDAAAKDPEGERKKICDAFASLGVQPAELTAYLGHDIRSCSPQEIVDLRGLYGAIKDGEASWKSAMENKRAQDEQAPKEIDIDKPPAAPKTDKKASAGGKALQPSAEPAPEPEGPDF